MRNIDDNVCISKVFIFRVYLFIIKIYRKLVIIVIINTNENISF